MNFIAVCRFCMGWRRNGTEPRGLWSDQRPSAHRELQKRFPSQACRRRARRWGRRYAVLLGTPGFFVPQLPGRAPIEPGGREPPELCAAGASGGRDAVPPWGAGIPQLVARRLGSDVMALGLAGVRPLVRVSGRPGMLPGTGGALSRGPSPLR